MHNSDILLEVKEGPGINYINALYEVLGGEKTNSSYYLNTEDSYISIQSFEIFSGMELLITEGKIKHNLTMQRTSDEDPDVVYINLHKQGQVSSIQSSQKQHAEADTLLGGFIHNGLFELQNRYPSNHKVQLVSIRTSKKALLELLPESEELYDSLFGKRLPITYHLAVSTEVEKLTDDIFYYNDISFGRKALIKARTIEVLTSFLYKTSESMRQGELKGLHKEDYLKLMKLKKKLLSSFNQKITIQALADEFGFSLSKLKRDFKTLFDCSIYQFYTHAKMDEAFRLLKTGNRSVMEVGYEVGYTNISKFTEMFKKVKGLLPTEVSKLNLA